QAIGPSVRPSGRACARTGTCSSLPPVPVRLAPCLQGNRARRDTVDDVVFFLAFSLRRTRSGTPWSDFGAVGLHRPTRCHGDQEPMFFGLIFLTFSRIWSGFVLAFASQPSQQR